MDASNCIGSSKINDDNIPSDDNKQIIQIRTPATIH